MATLQATADSQTAPPIGADRPRRRRYLAVVPMVIWIIVLVAIPNLYLLIYSFWTSSFGTVDHTSSLENYKQLLSSEVFRLLFKRTLLIAIVSSLLATSIAYVTALIVVRKFGRYKLLAALLILIPLWVSYLMRIFAWKIILGDNGLLTGLAKSLGLGDSLAGVFLYSRSSVILTLTYVAIPYAFLSVYTSLDRIPGHLLEASADCGASAWTTFRKVVWPLSRPGAAIGFGIAFVLTFGDYVTPSMVGGLSGTMLGSLVLQEFGIANNWPVGAAVGITIIATGLLLLAVVSLFTRLEAPLD